MSLLYEEETYTIIGAAIEVHRELGHGFLEAVYQEALEKEFREKSIQFQREVPLRIYYKKRPLNKYYIADFICYNKIIIELKTVSVITKNHYRQLLNYLTATGLKLGLILNYGKQSLEYRRIAK